jgi:DNA-directed RNA polymerase subunit N
MLPVRCFSCGKPIAQSWDEYKKRTAKGEGAEKVLDELGFNRYCCRRMFISQRDTIDSLLQYRV